MQPLTLNDKNLIICFPLFNLKHFIIELFQMNFNYGNFQYVLVKMHNILPNHMSI